MLKSLTAWRRRSDELLGTRVGRALPAIGLREVPMAGSARPTAFRHCGGLRARKLATPRHPHAALVPRPSSLAPAKGFTLLEMLAVIVLIGIIGTIVVTQVGKNMQKGKYGAGKAQLITLGQKIQNYALDNGAPPKTLQALLARPAGDANWLGPYAKTSSLKDPWGHAFGYKYPGDHGNFDLIFYGRDGKPGGDGFDKDVGNWQ